MSKSVKQLGVEYSQLDLYKQGAAGRLLYLSYPWSACFNMTVRHKRIPYMAATLLCYLEGDQFEGWWTKSGLERIARFYMAIQFKKPGSIQQLHAYWSKTGLRPVLSMVRKIEKTDLSALSNAGIIALLNKFGKFYTRSWSEAIFLDVFDLMGEIILEEQIRQSGILLSEKDKQLLTAPVRLSSLQKERLSLLAIADYARTHKKLLALLKNNVSLPWADYKPVDALFVKKIQAHAKEFYWIYNDYAQVRRVAEDEFLGSIRQLLNDPLALRKEKNFLFSVEKTKPKQEILVRKKKIPKNLASTLALLVALAAWRDERKMHCLVANAALRLFAVELARRAGIPPRAVENLFVWELSKLFTKRKPALIALGRKREKGSFYDNDLPSNRIFFAQDARYLRSVVNQAKQAMAQLAGKTAYPGVVSGRVKIVLLQDEFGKIKPGDILVAHNTRPEYVPIMKLAGAIITEEGGITSHAAIVSRELKIPCVVGMQGITSLLKDGDMVEVDATKGIVKKL